ncbi:MAG: hypothetical protein IPK07_33595 [Deltaproteobacteria bacterium]|nr:hypothetical protein [Deltaproteobacteria bacterium]
MRLALFAPVNHPDRPEGRDALALARELARHVDLTVYVRVDPARPSPHPAGLHVESQQRFERAALAGAFDHVLYFLANDAFVCEYVGRRLGTERNNRPGGIVLLRDATLQHYFQTVTLYLGDARNYGEGMTQAHGALGALAAPVVTRGGGHDSLFRELDMLRFFLESAAAVLVPTRDLARRVQALGGQLAPLVGHVPRGVEPAEADRSLRTGALAAAGIMGAAPDAPAYLVRVGSTPFEAGEARAAAIELRRLDPGASIVLQGGEPQAFEDAGAGIGWMSGAPPDEGPLPAWDGVLDPREPVSGAAHAEVLRWLSAGVPLAVVEFPPFDEIPSDALARVRACDGGAALARAITDPARRAALASAGPVHARRHATRAVECAGMLSFLRQSEPELRERTVILGNIREAILAERRRALCLRIRDAVFEGVPTHLPGGLGTAWVREIEDELISFGLDFRDPDSRSG